MPRGRRVTATLHGVRLLRILRIDQSRLTIRRARGATGYSRRPMKMVVAIVHPEDAGALVDALTDKDYRVTRLHSQGGFLKQSHATILAGVEEAQVDDVLATIRETCHARSQFINPMPPIMEPGEFYMPYPVEVTFGGATVFVVDV